MAIPLIVSPNSLKGPRSYFTDIDPKDSGYNQLEVVRKLKLQLLTKKNIVIAASSLFHDIGFRLFSTDLGLTKCLQDGIILPAVRDEFEGVGGFFDSKNSDDYTLDSKSYFTSNSTHYVPWNLHENALWFQKVFTENVLDENSLFREKSGIPQQDADDIVAHLKQLIEAKPGNTKFLSREDISKIAASIDHSKFNYLNEFSNLIYRISGARVVNCEGHFPQSNLTNMAFAGNEQYLTDTRIFWELYIEAVISNIASAARLSEDRIDSLSFHDILTIREGLFTEMFAESYDSLINSAKAAVNIHDPAKLLMTQEEITAVSSRLRTLLCERIKKELTEKDNSAALIQLGSVIEMLGDSIFFGTVSALKAIPEITALVSERLANAIRSRVNAVKGILNSVKWLNDGQRKALISGYILLLNYGLPKID